MTVFLTGGAGKTSRRIAAEIARISPSTPILTSSRSAPAVPSKNANLPVAHFDWLNPETYTNPFNHPTVQVGSPVSAIYVVLPPTNNPLPEVQSFLHVALENRGTSESLTVVLLSSDTIVADTAGSSPHSRVHAYLQSLAASHPGRVRYAVLRPSFFMENFSEQQHRSTITDANNPTIYSATGAGREAFISAESIAAVGALCLLGRVELDRDYLINGPEYLTYGEVAAIVSQVSGRHVTHTDLAIEQLAERYVAGGLPREYAMILAGLDERIRDGNGNEPNGTVEKLTGRKGITFVEFASKSKDAWK